MVNWVKKISAAREAEKSYRDKGKSLWDKYSSAGKGESKDVVNIFNPTVDILLAALYSNNPKPDIRRRFSKKDEKNPKKDSLYRAMASCADYMLQYNFDRQDMSEDIRAIVLDGLITGRGVGQLVYDYDSEPETLVNGDGEQVVINRVTEQVFKMEHIDYQDFVQEKCKKQRDVSWMARMHLFTKEEFKKEFDISEEDIEDISFTYSIYNDDNGSSNTQSKYAQVWEVWDKESKKRIYICESYKNGKPLKEDDDPYKLEGFFPFDIFKTVDNGKDTLPTAEYCLYEELNKQLQKLNKRSINLTNNSIKHVTVANASDRDLQDNIKKSSDGDVVGVTQSPNLSATQQVGALPIAEAILVKDKLDADSIRIVDQIWELTSVSDIMRGSSQLGETATAQKQKGVFGSLRMQSRQKKVQSLIRSSFRKMAEAVCQFSTIQQLKDVTCLELLTEQEKQQLIQAINMGRVEVDEQTQDMLNKPTWEEVKAGLTNDSMRGYTIDIESTATVFDNVEEERRQMAEMTANIINMLSNTSQLVSQSPSVIGLMEQLTLANLSTFKNGRNYTDSIKELFASIKEELSQPQQPNPAIEMQQQKDSVDLMVKQQKAKIDEQKIILENEYKNKMYELDKQKALFDAQDKARNTDIKQAELDLKQQELNVQAYLEEQKILKGIPTDANLPLGGVADLV